MRQVLTLFLSMFTTLLAIINAPEVGPIFHGVIEAFQSHALTGGR
jgi:small neutral amino acid transporter SnatA (MarC family)